MSHSRFVMLAYSAFGELLYSEEADSSYLFNGQEYDSGTGLYYYGAILQKTYVFFGLLQQASVRLTDRNIEINRIKNLFLMSEQADSITVCVQIKTV